MERTEFAYLFIHANSLAERALDLIAASLAPDMEDQADPYAHLSADEREALALAHMGNVDPASLQDGAPWETPEYEAEVRRSLEQLQQLQQEPAAAAPGQEQTAPAEAPDLALYLERAYAAKDLLEGRIDRARAQVDQAALGALLAALPADLAPLSQALDAQQFGQWLACYQGGNAALDGLVALLA